MPVSLLVFIFFQNFTPLLLATSALGFTARTSEIKRVPAAAPAFENTLDLKKVKDGIYYSFKADYSCIPKNSKIPLPSHVDSWGISSGKICHLGDMCNESFDCKLKLPAGMDLSKDEKTLSVNGIVFNLQSMPNPDSCEMPSCATPPGNCRYSTPAPLDGKGCVQGCGSMTCKLTESCPHLECPVPPANCYYDEQGSKDAANCPRTCGKIICDTLNPAAEVACPKLDCAPAPENCHYDRQVKKDTRGCRLACGNLTCEHLDPKRAKCKPVECSQPPIGCSYEGEVAKDENGCKISCGSLACVKNNPEKCKIPKCDRPPVNCRYDGNSPLNFDGCSTGCGNLLCNSETPL